MLHRRRRRPGRILANAKLDCAWNSGLESLTPATEVTPHQYAINGSRTSMQKA
jgi:hypothetical protein